MFSRDSSRTRMRTLNMKQKTGRSSFRNYKKKPKVCLSVIRWYYWAWKVYWRWLKRNWKIILFSFEFLRHSFISATRVLVLYDENNKNDINDEIFISSSSSFFFIHSGPSKRVDLIDDFTIIVTVPCTRRRRKEKISYESSSQTTTIFPWEKKKIIEIHYYYT